MSLEVLIEAYKYKKVWTVLYSHCSGDVGFESGLTYTQADRKLGKLLEEPKHLDFAKLLIEV